MREAQKEQAAELQDFKEDQVENPKTPNSENGDVQVESQQESLEVAMENELTPIQRWALRLLENAPKKEETRLKESASRDEQNHSEKIQDENQLEVQDENSDEADPMEEEDSSKDNTLIYEVV
eukprot:TRINITY_DN1170_c3_g1_i3.p1 TRINITY_DN1170_c3_g1~~TRINITY_DN1170_c3_g1_i3.p1  ORF type:complete len:137 (-),score=75.22 TRINITY_DN1170_c3_g1_i3:91-459(-)